MKGAISHVCQTNRRDATPWAPSHPKFAELNDDVLFGQVWNRADKLSLRDRSLVTVTALMAAGAGGFVLPLSPHHRQAKRHHPAGNRGNSDPRGLLRGLAQGLGGLPHGQGGLGGGCRQCRTPSRQHAAGDGVPHRRAQRRLCAVFRRARATLQPLSTSAGGRLQRDL